MTAKIQWRRDLAANWAAANPILAEAEAGAETDVNPYKFKIGDGITAWNDLPYEGAGGGGSFNAINQIILVSSNVNLTNLACHLVTTSAPFSLQLPAPTSSAYIVVKDLTGNAGTNNITILQHGAEKIEGTAASYVLNANFEQAVLVSNGTDWSDIS